MTSQKEDSDKPGFFFKQKLIIYNVFTSELNILQFTTWEKYLINIKLCIVDNVL